jgi:hypothetical protein
MDHLAEFEASLEAGPEPKLVAGSSPLENLPFWLQVLEEETLRQLASKSLLSSFPSVSAVSLPELIRLGTSEDYYSHDNVSGLEYHRLHFGGDLSPLWTPFSADLMSVLPDT